MSTALEDRLTSALQARAVLVQPEDLRHLALPTPESPRWRRPVVVALVAAAAAAAVAVPLTLSHHTSDQPLPPTGIPTPVPSLSGDVDGDGRPDRVAVTDGMLGVTLATDPRHALVTNVSNVDPVGLIGFAELGGPGQGIVVAVGRGTSDGAQNWGVYAVRQGDLQSVSLKVPPSRPDSIGPTLGVIPGYLVSWITPTGDLMSGLLDPAQQGAQRLSVTVRTYLPIHGLLSQEPVGAWCWDTASRPLPAPCPAGLTDAFDPGPRGSLPALLPSTEPDQLMKGGTWRDGSTVLRLVKRQPHTSSVLTQRWNLVGAALGRQVSARAPGDQPLLYERFVDLGHGVRGLVFVDATVPTWDLLALTDHGLVALRTQPPDDVVGLDHLHPGTPGMVVDGTQRDGRTWIGPDGQVFTGIDTGEAGHYHLYRWQVTDATGSTLRPFDLGTVCLDDLHGTYGTCAD